MSWELSFFTILLSVSLWHVSNADQDGLESKITPFDDILKELANEVCVDLSYSEESFNECLRVFTDPTIKPTDESRKATLYCQDKDNVVLKVEPPSSSYQLVVLVHKSNNSNMFVYQHLAPNETLIQFDIMSNYTYDVYTTALGPKGETGLWEPGPFIKPLTYIDKISGNINLTQVEGIVLRNVDDQRLEVTFTWEPEEDECTFSVLNLCDHDTLGVSEKQTIIKSDNTSVTVTSRMGDNCTFKVIGSGRMGSLRYQTPQRNEENESSSEPYDKELLLIKNLTVSSVISANKRNFDVIARWNKPKYSPSFYVVMLNTDSEWNITLPGNATKAVFFNVKNVVNLYQVTLMAVYSKSNQTAVDNVRGIFFSITDVSTWEALTGVLGGTLVLSLGVAMLACRRRRIRDKIVEQYFPDVEEKSQKYVIEDTPGHGLMLLEDDWEVRPDRLLLHEVLGEGAFGIVRKATLTPETKEVAVKMLKEFPSIDEVRSFRAEMDLMKSVGGHPHIVSLVGCCNGRRPYIVSEYCSRGDLLNYLRCAWDVMLSKRKSKYYNNNSEYGSDYRQDDIVKTRNESKLVINRLYDLQGSCDTELTPVDLLSFCRQMAMGMEFLASNRVVHRDLAARNVLVCADYTLKIADFGLSRDVYQDNHYKQKGNGKLPIKWMAIESLVHRLYTSQSDVWSFGVVMWEVVTMGGSPYPGVAPTRLPRLLRAGYRMPKPNNCTQMLYDLMQSCWKARPRDRPTFSELHLEIDSLLQNAASDYLTLEIDYEDHPITTKCLKNRSLFARSKLYRWVRGEEIYERPLKAALSNHYTSTPNVAKMQIV